MVENGRFREDLYFRLVVVPIEIPPLRDRPEDIPELVCEFFNQSTTKYSRKPLKLPQELLPYFSQYHWPGNVRQLQNVIERMVVLCPGDEITITDLPAFLRPSAAFSTGALAIPDGMTLHAIEKQALLQAMLKSNWNRTRAAQQLGVTRKVLTARMAKYGLEKPRRQLPSEEACSPVTS
jgi:DNA-binding NtrC family response regulator